MANQNVATYLGLKTKAAWLPGGVEIRNIHGLGTGDITVNESPTSECPIGPILKPQTSKCS